MDVQKEVFREFVRKEKKPKPKLPELFLNGVSCLINI